MQKCSQEISRAGNEVKHNVSEIRSISIIGVGGNMTLMMETEKVLETLVLCSNMTHLMTESIVQKACMFIL